LLGERDPFDLNTRGALHPIPPPFLPSGIEADDREVTYPFPSSFFVSTIFVIYKENLAAYFFPMGEMGVKGFFFFFPCSSRVSIPRE